MASLAKKLTVLKQRKSNAKKNRTKTSKTLRLAKLLYKKSVSGTNSIQHKMDNFRSELEDISTILQQKFAQRDSITSLIEQAENRLTSEKEKYDEIKEEISFATGEGKKQLEFTINTVSTEIEDLRSQLKSRKKTLEKVIDAAEEAKSVFRGFWGNPDSLSVRLRKQIKNLEKGNELEWAKLLTKISWLLTTQSPFYGKIQEISPLEYKLDKEDCYG